MVGTLRAASENDKQNGRCRQRPYIAERKQIRQSQNGNCGRCTQRPYRSPPILSPAHL